MTMRRNRPGRGHRGGLRGLIALLALSALVALPPAARADDVPEDLRAAYAAAAGLLAKGDRPNLESAFSGLDARKDEALASVDYWELYARVWQGLKKDDGELWKLFDERRAKAPKSPVFDLVRARLAKEADEKREWLDKAVKRDKENVGARVALAVFLLDQEEEDEADEMLDEILEESPDCVPALLARARLSLSDGFPGEAIEYLDQALEVEKSAAVYHLKSQAYRRMAKDKPKALEQALEAAAEALGLLPNEAHITSYTELLKETGDAATATKSLKLHFGRTRHPLLGSLLAESGFQAGDYEAAVLGLAAGNQEDLSVLKALAVCYARLGKRAEAKKATAKVMQMDSYGRLFTARLELHLGEAQSVLQRLGSLSDKDAIRMRAFAHAWLGQADAVKALADKPARTGSRQGEDLLIAWFQARLFQKMGDGLADAVRKKLLKARFEAGRKVLEQEGTFSVDLGKVKTSGWPRRAMTYFRSRCGTFYSPTGDGDHTSTSWDMSAENRTVTTYQAVHGEAGCGDEKQRAVFKFNGKSEKMTGNGFWFRTLTERVELKDFTPAEKAFAKACTAWLDGEHKAAESACHEVLRHEPSWTRTKALRAVARSLSPNGEKRADAKDAGSVVELWTDDFELRRLVVLLRAWAGDTELEKEIVALAEREAKLNVREVAGL